MSEEEIRTVLEGMDKDLVLEALALLLAEDRAPQPPAGQDVLGFVNFAQAIVFLKKNYGFAELDLFSTEADLVYVTSGDRRVLLTDLSVPDRKPARTPRPDLPVEAESGRFSHLEM
ncbi:MAG: hypothetical protein LBQ57_09620 [Spirochaetales bacterium]|jgi:hypothetical protein|nr:hypothetical protein [Spirochaetales bacterium]